MLQLDEYDELLAEELKREAEAERRRRAQAMSHPDPRDPDRRGSDDQEEPMPKFSVRIRRICTEYDYATVEVEATTAEEAAELCTPGEGAFDEALKYAEFDNSEVVDTEYEVDESYEVTLVEEQP